MIKIFQFLISGCWHKWEESSTARNKITSGGNLLGLG